MADTNDAVTPAASGNVKVDVQPEPREGVGVSLRCHPGTVREENQDRVTTAATPLGRLVLVADGVGGDTGGAETAELATVEYARFLQGAKQGMSSTVAVLLIRRHEAFTGHLGDSRVYLAREGELRCLTRDHSVVRQMVDHGILSEQEAETHPKAHILTHSLGQVGVDLEVSSLRLSDGDMLLLCSDGLWAYVPEAELQRVLLSSGGDSSRAADELLHLALQAGAPDNVSVAVVGIAAAPARVPAPIRKGQIVSDRANIHHDASPLRPAAVVTSVRRRLTESEVNRGTTRFRRS